MPRDSGSPAPNAERVAAAPRAMCGWTATRSTPSQRSWICRPRNSIADTSGGLVGGKVFWNGPAATANSWNASRTARPSAASIPCGPPSAEPGRSGSRTWIRGSPGDKRPADARASTPVHSTRCRSFNKRSTTTAVGRCKSAVCPRPQGPAVLRACRRMWRRFTCPARTWPPGERARWSEGLRRAARDMNLARGAAVGASGATLPLGSDPRPRGGDC